MRELYTKQEAEMKLFESKQKQEKLMCPIFKKQCFKNCASFNNGFVNRLTEYDFNYKNIKKGNEHVGDDDLKIWSVIQCSCMNAIVTGYVQCDYE
jgi:hypothetical protein